MVITQMTIEVQNKITPPGHASVVHAFDAGSDSWGSGTAVSAPTVSKLTGEAPERNKDSIKDR